MPRISVLMPVYNVEKYIRQAVFSVLRQTYDDFEFIIVDDHSTDNSFNVLQELADSDARIRLFRNKKHLKIAESLNRGLEEAGGEYIIRMDGDDISAPDRFQVLVDFIQQNSMYDIVGTSMTTIDPDGCEIGKAIYSNNTQFLRRTLRFSTPVAHIWIAKRAVYKKLNGYRDLSGAEDYDFLLRAITADYKITNISAYFGYFARVRDGNTASSMGLNQLRLHDFAWKLFVERNKSKSNEDRFDQGLIRKPSVIRTGALYRLHAISNRFLRGFITTKNSKFIYLPFLMIALVSPYQFKYLMRRCIYRFLKAIYNS